MKKILIALSLVSTPASAQSVIGVLDGRIEHSVKDVEERDFLKAGLIPGGRVTYDGREHGDAVVNTIREEAPKSTILFSNIFSRSESGLMINWVSAKKALDWFHERGAKYVCTSFVTNNDASARDFVDHATELGLVIVASIGDNRTSQTMAGTPYPAMDERVIATRPDNLVMLKGIPREVIKMAVKVETSRAASGSGMTKSLPNSEGASFASARVCGKLAR